jgi:hypothetical protein
VDVVMVDPGEERPTALAVKRFRRSMRRST